MSVGLIALIPLLGAPWLVREKGHIYIQLAIAALPRVPGTRTTAVLRS